MKTADKIKCQRIEERDAEQGCKNGLALVENNRDRFGPFGSIKTDDEPIFIKTFRGDDIQLDGKSRWDYITETFKVLVDKANDAICIILENMYHAYVNRKYCEMTGYSAPELEKIRMVELILAEERKAFKNAHRLYFSSETNTEKNKVATVIRKDGKKCSIDYSRSKIVWKGEPAIKTIIRDVTENLEKEKMMTETNCLLRHQIENITAELISSSEKLKQKHSELVRHKMELESVNKELLQTNRAMSVLARNIVKKKNEVEQKIACAILTKIIPIINDLKKKDAIQKYIAEIELLSVYVKGLAPEADQYSKILVNLSATEMRIATLIKNGMSNQTIADSLHISIETVKTHRKRIRKKLEINNSNTNLTSYLRSVMSDKIDMGVIEND